MPVAFGSFCAGFSFVFPKIRKTVSLLSLVWASRSLLGCSVLLSVLNRCAVSDGHIRAHPLPASLLWASMRFLTCSLNSPGINPVLEMKQPRLRRLSNLFMVAQLLGGPALSEAAAHFCLLTETPESVWILGHLSRVTGDDSPRGPAPRPGSWARGGSKPRPLSSPPPHT